jgi:ABC-type thiamine transport system substrate-binding protein
MSKTQKKRTGKTKTKTKRSVLIVKPMTISLGMSLLMLQNNLSWQATRALWNTLDHEDRSRMDSWAEQQSQLFAMDPHKFAEDDGEYV